jgi:hypothetical protein
MSDSLGLDRGLKVEEFDLPDDEDQTATKVEGKEEAPVEEEVQYNDASTDDL